MCTNNKDIFLTILRWHVRAAHLQYLRNLEADLADAETEDDGADTLSVRVGIEADKNDGISCELGLSDSAVDHGSEESPLHTGITWYTSYGIYHVI